MNFARTTIIGFVIFGICLVGRTASGDDIADLQGNWEMVQTRNGVEQRVIKTIQGRTETVELYVDKVLMQKHEVDISIEELGPVKIFAWKNGLISAGPRKGQKLPDGRCIYRLEDKTWIAVHGMIQGDAPNFIVEVYKRPPPRPST